MLSYVACKALIKESARLNKEIKKFDSKGLYLHVYPNGSAIWKYKYRLFDKPRKISIGPFPIFSLQQAREKHSEYYKLVAENKDPVKIRENIKKEVKAKNNETVRKVGEEWYNTNKPGWKERYAQTIKTRLEQDIYPELGNLAVGDVPAHVVLAALRKIEARKAVTIARKCLGYIGQIFRYANNTGRPAQDVSTSLYDALKKHKVTHHRAMEAEDLPGFLYAFDRNEQNLGKPTRNLVEMMLHTFVRTNELRRAEKIHFHFDTSEWRIPGEWMKMDNDHIVPLSKQMVRLVKEQISYFPDSPFLFPSSYGRAKFMSAGTINSALDAVGFSEKHTGHGFRALAKSTIMEKITIDYNGERIQKYSEPIVDVQLAHAPKSSNGRAYDRAKFLSQRAKMMQEWSDHLDECRVKGLQKTIENRKHLD